MIDKRSLLSSNAQPRKYHYVYSISHAACEIIPYHRRNL
jgi:hypothetical protein